jgi:hypothetical protein
MRQAIVAGDEPAAVPLLIGGGDPARRLAIHRRTYEASLVTALMSKIPATTWLAGSPLVVEAARRFVRESPPSAPCIAEFGSEFPVALSDRPEALSLPYLRAFAELEWLVGQIAIAVERRPIRRAVVRNVEPAVLIDARYSLQPGLRYLRASWPVDDLMRLYLSAARPERFLLEPADVLVEARGSRGEFRMARLDAGVFAFRRALLEGNTLGDAAERAFGEDAAFDPGGATAAIFDEGLITQITGDDGRCLV